MRFVPIGCIRGCWAKLVQKFVPRSRVGFFRNEHTRYSPLDTKITFWCVSYYLGAFRTICLPYDTRCKMGRTSAKVRATKSRRNFFTTNPPDPPHWTLNWRFGAFRIIWVHLGPFCCLTQLGAKRAESSCHEVVSEFFATDAPDPPPLDSKLTF